MISIDATESAEWVARRTEQLKEVSYLATQALLFPTCIMTLHKHLKGEVLAARQHFAVFPILTKYQNNADVHKCKH